MALAMDAASDVHRGGLDDSHACPICRETFSDAFNTMCGHTFCYACIVEHLARAHACPCCAQPLTAESLFPNLALDKLLKQLSRSGQLPGSPRSGTASPALGSDGALATTTTTTTTTTRADDDANARGGSGRCPARRTKEIAESINSLPLEELTPLLRSIADKHDRLVKHDKRVSVGALRDFLALSWKRKNDAIRDLEREVGRIDVDVNWIERQIDELGGSHALRALVEERAAATAAAAARAASPNGGGGGGGGGGASAATAAAGREPGEDPPPSPHQPSRARASAAASMVCEMLSAWGIERRNDDARGGASYGQTPSRLAFEAARPAAAAPGSKRTSVDMMRGSGSGGGGGGGGGSPPSRTRLGRTTEPGGAAGSADARAAAADGRHVGESLASVDLSETKRARVLANFANLQDLYSKIRCGGFGGLGGGRRKSSEPSAAAARGDLDEFANLMRSLTKVRSVHWSPYDRVGVVNADP